MGNRNSRISSRDVARVAGVSQQTVSLVARDSPLIPFDTKSRVQKVIEDLGYQPHAAAMALRSARSLTLGYFESHVHVDFDAFRNQVLHGVRTRAKAADYHVLLDSLSDPRRCLALLKSGRIDGALVDWQVGDALLREIAAGGAPIVLVGRETDDVLVGSVRADEEGGSYQMTRHLLALGHRCLAVFVGDDERGGRAATDSNAVAHARVRGWERAIGEAGLPDGAARVYTGEWNDVSGYSMGLRALGERRRPTAIFVLSELMAVGVLRAAADLGLRVPEDVSVVTIQESPWAKLVRPQLTAVHVPMDGVGAQAADALLAQLANPASPPPRVVLPTTLVVRESCGPPPASRAH